jgi:hypothetical protein
MKGLQEDHRLLIDFCHMPALVIEFNGRHPGGKGADGAERPRLALCAPRNIARVIVLPAGQ